MSEKFEIASNLLKQHKIKHKEIISTEMGVYKEEIPFFSIWYKNEQDEIIGTVLEHHGEWKMHIHNGEVIE